MAQELGALAALAEDLSFVTITHMVAYSRNFRQSEALFWLPYACVHIHITKHIYVNIYINLKGKKMERITVALLGIP